MILYTETEMHWHTVQTKTVLQIRRSNKDNLGIIIHIFFYKNIFCDPSLEPSDRDGSNDGSQHMFLLKNKKNYL